MSQQPTSLLSLPDELLVRIFNHLAERLWRGVHPLWPLTHVCRRVRSIAQAALYRDVVVGLYQNAVPNFQMAVKENPSVGQLVDTLAIIGAGSDSDSDSDEEAVRHSELVLASTSAVSNLKELVLSDTTTEEVSAILTALPSMSLRSLTMRFCRTPDPFQWLDLRLHVARFSELRMLTCRDWRPESPFSETETAPRATAHASQPIVLPQLVSLHTTDHILIEAFGPAGPLWQILPNLRELQITISRSEDSSAITAILSEAPSSLAAVKLLSDVCAPQRGYLPTLPALRHLTHLHLGPWTFIESELLVYLPMAPLEYISFDLLATVTDRLLQAHTGPGRPPQLRRICLNHVGGASPESIRHHLEMCLSEDDAVEEVRHEVCPQWPAGGTEQGLRHALAAANANGLEVTGSALACADWNATFDKVLVDLMMEQAHKTDVYGDVIARFGEEVAVAWLKEHAPHTVRLLHAHMSVLESDNRVP